MVALRRIARAMLRVALGLAGFIVVYGGVALMLGLVPVNRRAVPPAYGIEIFVVSNGVHAALALPMVSPAADLRAELPLPPGSGDGRDAFVMIGWGDRRVYIETRTWADLTLSNAVTALLGLNETVMHVEHIRRPEPSARFVPTRVGEAGYRRLLAHIGASLRRDARGRPIRIAGASHGRQDAFYEAHGRYTFIYTCNEWVREGLAVAGVRTTAWAPFEQALFRHLAP